MNVPSRQLWRLTGADLPLDTEARSSLARSLRLHVAHAPLDSVLMRIGVAEQAYVVLAGCRGCAWNRCEGGCRVALLRRAFGEHAPTLGLAPVRGGLATRPYTRAVLGVPVGDGPLQAELVQHWPEARLAVQWQPDRRREVTAAALLLVGEDGPDPAGLLRERGWRAWPLPAALGQRWAMRPLPPVLPFGRALRGEPELLLLHGATTGETGFRAHEEREGGVSGEAGPTDSGAPLVTERLDEGLAGWLRELLADPARVAGAPIVPEEPGEPSPWPLGPGSLQPAALGSLVTQLIAEPSFQSTRKGQSGISKGRLAGLKHPGLSENIARALMVWLDRAGVLAPPEDGQLPWRAPRPFALTDLEQIAAKLRDTPIPTSEEIRAAYGGEG